MIKNLFAMVTSGLLFVGSQAWAAPPHGGGQYVSVARHGGGSHYGNGHFRGHYDRGYYGSRYTGWGGYWVPGVGIYYGGLSFGYGFGYPYPYATYAPLTYAPYAPLVISAEPLSQVLIQRDSLIGDTPLIEKPTNYWYYCTQPPGYFPYVQNCSQAWMKVVPQIPADLAATPSAVP